MMGKDKEKINAGDYTPTLATILKDLPDD